MFHPVDGVGARSAKGVPVCDAPVPLSRRRACPVLFEPSLGHVICEVAIPERDFGLSLLR